MTRRTLSFGILALGIVTAACGSYDYETYKTCLESFPQDQRADEQDACWQKARKVAAEKRDNPTEPTDKTPPHIVRVCVDRRYSYHNLSCVRHEYRCVWGKDYTGMKYCPVYYPTEGSKMVWRSLLNAHSHEVTWRRKR